MKKYFLVLSMLCFPVFCSGSITNVSERLPISLRFYKYDFINGIKTHSLLASFSKKLTLSQVEVKLRKDKYQLDFLKGKRLRFMMNGKKLKKNLKIKDIYKEIKYTSLMVELVSM